eukprot:236570-Chlamydomonas_euryale.AAC.2
MAEMAGTRLGPHCLSNDALYDRMGSWPLSRHVDRSRLRYLGHICRMPDGSLAKHMLFATQLAGVPLLHHRPKRRWIDCARATLRELRVLH